MSEQQKEKDLTDEEMIEVIETQTVPFSLPTAEEKAYIKETAEDIVKSNFFGEKNVAAARIKVKACLTLRVDPNLFYKHIQIMDFKGSKVLTQSAFLMIYLAVRTYGPQIIKQQGWVGKGDDLKFNMLIQHPMRDKPEPFSFSLAEGKHAQYHLRNTNWEKVPKDMTRARCRRRCVVTAFPEVLGGIIYTPADFDGVEAEA